MKFTCFIRVMYLSTLLSPHPPDPQVLIPGNEECDHDLPRERVTPLRGLNGDVCPDRVWFAGFFCLKRGINFITFCGLSLHWLNGKIVHLKSVKIVQKAEFVPFLLALMSEAYTTTKLDKDIWLNVFRRGLQTLDVVLNRVGKSEISVLNRVRVWAPQPHLPTQTSVEYSPRAFR